MRISKVLSSAVASAALVAAAPVLAGDLDAGSDWRQISYSCETGQALTVAFRDTGSAVQVAASDRPAVKLLARPAKAGFRYSDSRHELRGAGEEVTWQIGSRTPVKCTSSDPAAASVAAIAAG
ncbi:MAG: MliC family protein [Gammaproteobacteria bacterium]